MTVKGTVEYREIGTGAWVLVGENGTTYELGASAPDALLKSGLTVEVEGNVDENAMTLAAIGPVLEVKTFKEV